jgi:hypothetical protein
MFVFLSTVLFFFHVRFREHTVITNMETTNPNLDIWWTVKFPLAQWQT